MIDKFIDIQAKILSFVAFADSECDDKEKEFYVNFLNTLEIPNNKGDLYLSYIENPPSEDLILNEISRNPIEIILPCIKNSYLMAMCSNGLSLTEKNILIKMGNQIGLKESDTDKYFDMLDKYYQIYQLERNLFDNYNSWR